MILKENKHNEIVAMGKYGEETIHLIHCNETIKEIKEDCATPYLVAEECTNIARIHLVTDFSEDEALQQVAEYLTEEEGVSYDEVHLIGVFECEIQ